MRRLVIALCLCAAVAEAGLLGEMLRLRGRPTAAASFDPFPIKTGLVGAWLVDGYVSGDTVLDASGCGNHGHLTNGASWASGSAVFDGNNDYVRIPQTNDALWKMYQSYKSVFAWVKRDTTSRNDGIIQGRTYNANPAFALFFDTGDDVKLYVSDKYLTKATTIDTNWHFVGFTCSYGAVTGYVDAVVAYTGTVDSFYQAGAGLDVVIGGIFAAYYFDGKIDTVSIHTNVLSDAQVTTLYNNGKTGGRHQ